MRKEKQDRLKDRVVNSKALVDNSKALENKRKQQQEDFKRNLNEDKIKYQQELARRLQRVYNKPLMFETVTNKVDKFSLNRNMQDKLNEIMYNQDGDNDKSNIKNNDSKVQDMNEDDIYEEKFDNVDDI